MEAYTKRTFGTLLSVTGNSAIFMQPNYKLNASPHIRDEVYEDIIKCKEWVWESSVTNLE